MSITKDEAVQLKQLISGNLPELGDEMDTAQEKLFLLGVLRNDLISIIDRETEGQLVNNTVPWVEVAADALRSEEYDRALSIILAAVKSNDDAVELYEYKQGYLFAHFMASERCMNPNKNTGWDCAYYVNLGTNYMCYTCMARQRMLGPACRDCHTYHSGNCK